ncbi:MAG TPA: DUF6531 domain-containing protein, partial [Acidimicrobiales bacterium]
MNPRTGVSTTFGIYTANAIAADATHVYTIHQNVCYYGGVCYHRVLRHDLNGNATAILADTVDGSVLASAGAYLYARDRSGHAILRITKATGAWTNVAGASTAGYADGTGSGARFNGANGMATDGQWLWVSDYYNNRVRVVAARPVLLPGGEQFGNDPYSGMEEDVNPSTGNFVHTEEDLEVAGVGPMLGVNRTYNSLDTSASGFGPGWSLDYQMRWDRLPFGAVAVQFGDGRREVHTPLGDGTFAPPVGYFSKLTPNAAGAYDLRMKDGTKYVFSDSGLLSEIRDDHGRRLSFNYIDTRVNRVAMVNGRGITFGWTGDRITSVSTDHVAAHGGQLVWRYYYTDGKLTRACNPRDNSETGHCTVYTWTGDRITKVTKPEGNTEVEVAYDPQGRVDWRKNGVGGVTDFTYVSAARTETKDPRLNTTVQEFDTRGRVVKETDAAAKVTTYEYDEKGNRSKVTDAAGNVSTMKYDADGNMIESTNGEGHTAYYVYVGENRVRASDGRSTSLQDARFATVYEYVDGLPTKEVSPPTPDFPNGVVKQWTYTDGVEAAVGGGVMPKGLVRTEVDGRGKATSKRYNAAGDLVEVVDTAGLLTTYGHDELGRVTTEDAFGEGFPGGTTTTKTYDRMGEVATETAPVQAGAAGEPSHQLQTTHTYDRNSNLERVDVADLIGGNLTRTTINEYDDADRQVKVTDPENGVLLREFDAAGNVIRVTDPAGRVTETEYDARNLATKVTLKAFVDDPIAGSAPRDVVLSETTYDDVRRKKTEKDALGRVKVFTYDKADRLKKVEQLDYQTLTGALRTVVLLSREYDGAGNVTSETQGGSQRVDTVYDGTNRVTRTTLDPDGLNRVTEFAYDGNGGVVLERVTGGGVTEETRRTFDDGQRLTSTTVENGAVDIVTRYQYDQRDNLVATTDPRGSSLGDPAFTTNFEYDAFGHRVRTIAPPVEVETASGVSVQRPASENGYTAFGEPSRMRDGRGNVTVTGYDRLGRRTSVTHPSYTPEGQSTIVATESFAYDAVGNLTVRTDRRGVSTEFTFDKMNRVVRQLDPAATVGGARGSTRYTYDDTGFRTSEVDQVGARREWVPDALGRVRYQTDVVRQPVGDAARYTTTFDYDDLGRTTYTSKPNGATTHQTWNNAGEVVEVTDAIGKKTTHSYDLRGRKRKTTDPLGRSDETIYDLAGRPVETRRIPPTGSTLPTTTTASSYDLAGNKTSHTSALGFTTTWSYDAVNRLRTATQPITDMSSLTASYGYDEVSNVTKVTDGRGNVTTATFTPWNLPEITVEPATAAHPAAADRTWRTRYDVAGAPVGEVMPGGVAVTRTVDLLGRTTGESASGGGAPAASRTFGYDLAGRRTTAGHSGGSLGFAWDDRDQLTSATSPTGNSSFAYDPAGRMTSRTDSAGTSSFTWTPRDELLTAVDPLTGVQRSYEWNDASDLTKVTHTPGGAVRTYSYDDHGRLTGDVLTAGAVVKESQSYGYDNDDNLTSETVVLPGNAAAGASSYQ